MSNAQAAGALFLFIVLVLAFGAVGLYYMGACPILGEWWER
jgi:hypothetical protein